LSNQKAIFKQKEYFFLLFGFNLRRCRLEQLLPSCDHMDPKNEAKTWKKVWPSWARDGNQLLNPIWSF
jgi:hypothetical protein